NSSTLRSCILLRSVEHNTLRSEEALVSVSSSVMEVSACTGIILCKLGFDVSVDALLCSNFKLFLPIRVKCCSCFPTGRHWSPCPGVGQEKVAMKFGYRKMTNKLVRAFRLLKVNNRRIICLQHGITIRHAIIC
ncbi:hypothetical protein L9F63_024601, partial [Diploptera punctata]